MEWYMNILLAGSKQIDFYEMKKSLQEQIPLEDLG